MTSIFWKGAQLNIAKKLSMLRLIDFHLNMKSLLLKVLFVKNSQIALSPTFRKAPFSGFTCFNLDNTTQQVPSWSPAKNLWRVHKSMFKVCGYQCIHSYIQHSYTMSLYLHCLARWLSSQSVNTSVYYCTCYIEIQHPYRDRGVSEKIGFLRNWQ